MESFMLSVMALALSSGAPRNNVLFILIDDIGNDYVNVYQEAPPENQPPTPVIDSLAAQGLRFLNAYSNTTCSPTRSMLFNGRHSHHTRIGTPLASTFSLNNRRFPTTETTLPEVLQAAKPAYRTALIGKWHLGYSIPNDLMDPVVHGFEVFSGTLGNVQDYFSWEKWTAAPWFSVSTLSTNYATIEVTNDALELMAEWNQGRRPWFLWLAYHAAHQPFHTPPRDLYSGPTPTNDQEKYMAMVESLDTEIGRLMDGVDLTRTTVFLMGDNGTPGTFTVPLDTGKASMLEGGVNIPFIVLGAEVSKEARGRTTDALISAVDFMPTVLELTGTALPPVEMDGISFAAVLRDPDLPGRDFAMSEKFKPLHGPYTKVQRMARGGRYKVIRDLIEGTDFLFDLATAPPGLDGAPLCTDCANELNQLSFQELTAYRQLAEYLDSFADPRDLLP